MAHVPFNFGFFLNGSTSFVVILLCQRFGLLGSFEVDVFPVKNWIFFFFSFFRRKSNIRDITFFVIFFTIIDMVCCD